MDSLSQAKCNDFYEVCGRWIGMKPKAPCLFQTLIIEYMLADEAVCSFVFFPNKGSIALGQKYAYITDKLKMFQNWKQHQKSTSFAYISYSPKTKEEFRGKILESSLKHIAMHTYTPLVSNRKCMRLRIGKGK